MGRPRTGQTPKRGVRLGTEFDDLETAVGDGNRTKYLRAGIRWYLSVHALWAHYTHACADRGTTPAADLKAHVETTVRDWHRRNARD